MADLLSLAEAAIKAEYERITGEPMNEFTFTERWSEDDEFFEALLVLEVRESGPMGISNLAVVYFLYENDEPVVKHVSQFIEGEKPYVFGPLA
jgi:hypothetical protein